MVGKIEKVAFDGDLAWTDGFIGFNHFRLLAYPKTLFDFSRGREIK